MNQLTFLNHAKPNQCFIELFQNDSQLVNEVGEAFSGSCLTVVCSRRSAAAKNLSSNMPASRRFGKPCRPLDDPDGKFDQPFLKQVCLLLICHRNCSL